MTVIPSRVLMTTDAVGGVWQFSLDLARGLGAAGVEVCLAVLGPAPSPAQRADAEAIPGVGLMETGLPLDWTAPSELRLTEAALALTLRAARAGPDLVQLNHPAFAEAPWAVPVLSVVHSCHGSWWRAMRGGAPLPPEFAWRSERMRRALARSDRVVAPTAALAGVLDSLYRPPQPVRVVRNGRVPLAPSDERVPEGPYVFTAGRLWDEAKNMAGLDAAASRIAPPVIAAGPAEGPNGEQVPLRNLNCVGKLSPAAMAAHHGSASVFVSLARYEPFGLAVLEAAQAGRPLVLSDIATFRELWDGAALFVRADDLNVLLGRVNRLLADPAEAARWGDRARERAHRYTVDEMVGGYLREYAEVTATAPSRLAG